MGKLPSNIDMDKYWEDEKTNHNRYMEFLRNNLNSKSINITTTQLTDINRDIALDETNNPPIEAVEKRKLLLENLEIENKQ